MQQGVSESDPESSTTAAKLFAQFVSNRGKDPAAEFEALCRAHPAQARELHLLAAHWERVEVVLEHFGGSNSLTLAGARSGTPADEHSNEVLRRLARHKSGASRYALKGEVARGGMGAILRV